MAKEIVKKIFKKEDIPVNLETRVYNGNNYEIGITLFSPFNESISMIKQESIKQIIIGNDLECFTPQLTLMYKDMNNVYWEFKSFCILRKRFVSKKLFGNYLFRSGVNKLRIRLHSRSKKRCVREIFKELEKDYPSGRYQNIHTFIFDHCWIYFQQKKAIPIIGNSMAYKHFFVS